MVDPLQDLCAVIVIEKVAVTKATFCRRIAKDIEVVLVLKYGRDPFTLPDIKGGIGNHPCIAASAGSAERMVVVYEEGSRTSLEDKPRLVGRQNRAGTMELGYIQGACLGPWWGDSDLCMYEHVCDV